MYKLGNEKNVCTEFHNFVAARSYMCKKDILM